MGLSEQLDHPLVGEKYLSIGGGNNNGILNASVLTQFVADLGQVQGYDGIMFDVEKVRGSFDTVNPKFNAAFAAVKAAGMKVAITVSHTAPYDTDSPQIATQLVHPSWPTPTLISYPRSSTHLVGRISL